MSQRLKKQPNGRPVIMDRAQSTKNGENGLSSDRNPSNGSKHSQLSPNPENFIPIPKPKYISAVVVVFIVAVVCYALSYDGDFVFDDSEAITGNKDVDPTTSVHRIFLNDFWGKKLADKTSHKSYRPLTVLTYRWSHYFAGGLGPNTWWFHVPNILLHGVISAFLVCVFSIIFGGYVVDQTTGKVLFTSPKSAFLCAILFAVHPIHSETVSGIVGRADLLCALLFLISFYLYIRACSSDITCIDNRGCVYRPETFSVPLILVSMATCCVSILCKEQGITVIGICSAYDIVVICGVDLLQAVGLKKPHPQGQPSPKVTSQQSSNPQPWVSSLVKRHLILLSTGVLILMARWRIMGSAPPTFLPVDNPQSFVNGTILRAVNYNYLYSLNCWLLINPWWLCFDWSMGCVPVLESLTDPRVLAVIVMWGTILSLIYTCFKDVITTDQRTLTMALALIVVPFLPASNLFFIVGFVIAERNLYLSSLGICVLVVLGYRQGCRVAPQHAKVLTAAFVLLSAAYMGKSVQRSWQWRTEMELFHSGAWVCPGNAKVHYNIGKLHADQGNTEYAIVKYRHAINVNEEYDQAMNNLGNLLKEKGELVEAEKLLQRAVEIREVFAAAWMNLGIVKASLNKFDEAEKCYITAIMHRNNYPDCYYNMGNLYLNAKRNDLAVQAWTNATKLKPTHSNAWTNLVVLLDNMGNYEESLRLSNEALKYLPDDPQVTFNIGTVYGKLKKYAESEKHILRALEKDPTNAKYYGNLGVLYHLWDKFDKADAAYKKALELNPNEGGVKENLKMLEAKREKLKRK